MFCLFVRVFGYSLVRAFVYGFVCFVCPFIVLPVCSFVRLFVSLFVRLEWAIYSGGHVMCDTFNGVGYIFGRYSI